MRSAKSSPPEQARLPWHAPGLVAGVDEAGRGPLAGPVVAAAVILDDLHPIAGLADSKKLTAARHERDPRPGAVFQHCRPASRDRPPRPAGWVMRAVWACGPPDGSGRGNRLPKLDIPAEAIVKGDALVPAISAASILAKVHRDRWCVQVDEQYPQYGFSGHKGYGTAVHMAALREHGACIHHRRSFAPVAKVLV
jgi:ribonuclease HII